MKRVKNRYIREVGDSTEWVVPKTIQEENPKTPIKVITDAKMAHFGCYPVFHQDLPAPTTTQKAVWDDLPTLQDGTWVLGGQVVDKTQEELLADVPWQDLSTAQVALAVWIDKLTYQIEGKYPSIIKAAWDEEEAMALAYKMGTETDAEREELTLLGAKKGRTADEHADRVLFLAGSFRAIKGLVHQLWLETDAALESAQSPLQFPAIFDEAIAKAAPLAAAYGLEVSTGE